MSNLKIAGIVIDSITDGPGIRTAVFVQGCPHRCAGCHNPDTHDFNGGTEMTVKELFDQIMRNPLLSGVTFTGGEPMCQAEPLARFAQLIKASGLEVAIYTGYTWEALLAENDSGRMELLRYTDVLVDGQFILAERSLNLKFRGSRNQRIINVAESLKQAKVILETSERWASHPLDSV